MDYDKVVHFVEYILSQIVTHKEELHVEAVEDERGAVVKVSVNPEDMGRVIGKSGKMVDVLRTLVQVMGAREKKRIALRIIEPQEA